MSQVWVRHRRPALRGRTATWWGRSGAFAPTNAVNHLIATAMSRKRSRAFAVLEARDRDGIRVACSAAMPVPNPSLRVCVLITTLAACTSPPPPEEQPPHASQLDGPVDYVRGSGFYGESSSLHLELDGAAIRKRTRTPDPTITTTGTITAVMLDQLRDDIAAVDLASFRSSYSCAELPCQYNDAGGAALDIAADGRTTHISIDLGLADSAVPAGLATIVADLDAIALQVP
jgi:hypothetical protein